MKKLAERGKYAYYYKGQLQFKEQQSDKTNMVKSRTFRKAFRRQPFSPVVHTEDNNLATSEAENTMEVGESEQVAEVINSGLSVSETPDNDQSQSENNVS